MMRWATTKEESDYLAMRQRQNRARSTPAEDWAAEHLKATGLKWTRQARWGYRLFDFWHAPKGVAVEIDGKEHNPTYDAARARYNYQRSGIVVLRVRNFNQDDMAAALKAIQQAGPWSERRAAIDLKAAPKAKSGKDKLRTTGRGAYERSGNSAGRETCDGDRSSIRGTDVSEQQDG